MSKQSNVSNLWMKAVEKNDRYWTILLCFLITVAVGLLAVVAFRLNIVETVDVSALVEGAPQASGDSLSMLNALLALYRGAA